MGPVPGQSRSWPGCGEEEEEDGCVRMCVCAHVCACAKERPWRGEGLQCGRMDRQSWAGSLLPSSSSCALCPEKPYLNK